MLRISFFTILLVLTGCQGEQIQNPVIGQIQQIESPPPARRAAVRQKAWNIAARAVHGREISSGPAVPHIFYRYR